MAAAPPAHPLLEALVLLKRWPSVAAIVLLLAEYLGERFLQTQALNGLGDSVSFALMFALGPAVASYLVGAVVIQLLARNLLDEQGQRSSAKMVRWIALYLFYCLAVNAPTFLTTLFFLSFGYSPAVLRFIALAVAIVAVILLFPMSVRLLALAAGHHEPKLGETWKRAFVDLREIYGWYAVTSVALFLLQNGSFSFLDLAFGPGDSVARAVLEEALSAFKQVIRELIALVAVRAMLPTGSSQAEAFR